MFSGLDTEAYDRTYRDRDLVRRIGGYFARDRRSLTWALVLIVALALVTAVQPLIVAEGINQLEEGPSTALLVGLVLLSLASGLFIWGANWLRRRLLVRLTGRVMSDLRVDALHGIEHACAGDDQALGGCVSADEHHATSWISAAV